MLRRSRSRNPFHAAVLVAGVAFSLTACSYGVMYVKQLHASSAGQPPATANPWLVLLDRHGPALLILSLAFLGIAALADVVWEFGVARRSGTDSLRDGSSEQDQGENGR